MRTNSLPSELVVRTTTVPSRKGCSSAMSCVVPYTTPASVFGQAWLCALPHLMEFLAGGRRPWITEFLCAKNLLPLRYTLHGTRQTRPTHRHRLLLCVEVPHVLTHPICLRPKVSLDPL